MTGKPDDNSDAREPRPAGSLILIAEDDEINRRLFTQQLRILGYRAVIVGSGFDALEHWRTGAYSILFTDLHMPAMDGYELVANIRREEKPGQRLPIIALTGSAPQVEADRARAAGIDGYLTKPLELRVLREALEQWLPRPGETASGGTRAVDVRILKNLVGDDGNIVREFLSEYIESARQRARELQAAYAASDAGRLGDAAHKLKSASYSIGATGLGDLCAALEDGCRSSNIEVIARQMARLETILQAVEREVAALLGPSP